MHETWVVKTVTSTNAIIVSNRKFLLLPTAQSSLLIRSLACDKAKNPILESIYPAVMLQQIFPRI